MFRTLIMCICLSSLITSTSLAISDTVHYRMLIGTLADSTRVQYEIGSFGLIQNGSIRYLKFNTATELPGTYFETERFGITSTTTDSIVFIAFVNYDDASFDLGSDADSGSAAFFEYAADIADHYEDLFISPNPTYFNSSSSILYILELRRKSDNTVLARLDTTKCYLNESDKLVYSNFPSSISTRIRKITNVSVGDTVYFAVKIIRNLPTGDFIGYDYTHVDRNQPADPYSEYDVSFTHYVFVPPAPIAAKVSPKAPVLHSLSVSPNPVTSSGIVTLTLMSDVASKARVRLTNLSGMVLKEKTFHLVRGSNQLKIEIPEVNSGSYIADVAPEKGPSSQVTFTLTR